jgi:subtilisin family serine protease
VISAGAVGWNEWFRPGSVDAPNFDFWWTQDVGFDPDRGRKGREADEVFVIPFSSRAIPDLLPGFTQELDVLAPGAFTVAPSRASVGAPPHDPPVDSQPGLFFVGGTSFAAPLTAGVAALILEKNPTLGQPEVEDILVSTALPLKAVDSRSDILIPFPVTPGAPGLVTFSWDTDCFGLPCDAVGAGLLQADAALAATPTP